MGYAFYHTFHKKAWLKSLIISLIVIFFNYIVRMPYSGDGFFALNAGAQVFYANILFNFPWAFLAGAIYMKTTTDSNI